MRRIIMVLACILAACTRPSSYTTVPTVPTACKDTSDSFSVTTFNTALAPGINEMASLREPAVIREVQRAFAEDDLVCLQEVWPPETTARMIAAMGLPPENVLTADTRGHNETGRDFCSVGELDGLAQCAREKCANSPPEDVSICVIEACKPSLLKLHLFSKNCFNCAAASVGHPIDEVLKSCYGAGASRFYHGANGVILLSRHRLENPEVVELPSSSANRVVLMARVTLPDGRQAEVGCTHLTARQYGAPTNPMFSDWDEEARTQVVIAAERLRNRAGNRPVILAGDLNFGPDSRGLEGEATVVWDYVHTLGYVSPAADASPAFCSICPENNLRYSKSPQLIDHVLLRNFPGGDRLEPLCVERLLDGKVHLGRADSKVVSNLSDHYAVRVRLRFR